MRYVSKTSGKSAICRVVTKLANYTYNLSEGPGINNQTYKTYNSA